MQNCYPHLEQLLGKEKQNLLSSLSILVVGAGGIGCELLKNLVHTPIHKITAIDLDTIDATNLNRQFLFRYEHVGKSKAEVAGESVLQMKPIFNSENLLEKNLNCQKANIKDTSFNMEAIKNFNIIINALDNIEARRHVNRLCLSANVPLIEAGSTGMSGQCTSIFPKVTQCFECLPKPVQKQYPVCTIRSTPDKPVHTIIWAKFLWDSLFGPMENENQLDDMKSRKSKDDDANSFATSLFKNVYLIDIQQQIEGEVLKNENLQGAKKVKRRTISMFESIQKESYTTSCTEGASDDLCWPIELNMSKFISSIEQMQNNRSSDINQCVFNKDDNIAVDFVTAASNLRSQCFYIQLQTKLQVAKIAGNIVPALATTNAIVAGSQVNELLKMVINNILPNHSEITTTNLRCLKNVWIRKDKKLPITSNQLEKPEDKCYICSKSNIIIELCPWAYKNDNTIEEKESELQKEWLFQDIINNIIIKGFSFNMPTINKSAEILQESGDDLDDVEKELYNNIIKKKLQDVGINDGDVLTIDDYSQDLKIDITIIYSKQSYDEWEKQQEGQLYIIKDDAYARKTDDNSIEKSNENISDNNNMDVENMSTKRKRDDDLIEDDCIIDENDSKINKL